MSKIAVKPASRHQPPTTLNAYTKRKHYISRVVRLNKSLYVLVSTHACQTLGLKPMDYVSVKFSDKALRLKRVPLDKAIREAKATSKRRVKKGAL